MDKKFSSFLNYAACSVLFVAFIALIVGASSFFLGEEEHIQKYQVVLSANSDSTFDGQKFSYYTDSLIQVINKHEHMLEDRYGAILEEKYDTQRYWSIAGIVASIVIAIFGVFGYKSFKDIESKCEDLVKAETAKILNEKLQGLVHAEMAQSQYSKSIEKRITTNIRNTILRNLSERITALENIRESKESTTSEVEVAEDIDEVPIMPNLPVNNETEEKS